jgi:biopolymer transport protein ExbD
MLVDGEPISDDDTLRQRAQAAFAKDPEVRAVIQADGDVPHRKTLHLLDLLKGMGISKVAFGALPEEEAP